MLVQRLIRPTLNRHGQIIGTTKNFAYTYEYGGIASTIRPLPQTIQSGAAPPAHTFKHLMSTSRDTSSIIYSENQPADISSRVSSLSEWSITPSKMGLTRQFTFPSFASAWRFMSLVADECKTKRHHPSWHNLYNQVTVEWTTHKPLGLSIKDVEMAEFCDRTANEIGLKKEKP